MLRRLADEPQADTRLIESDLALHATVLLIGRGGCFPALSVALGERAGVVGAFSIEAAAHHLANRDIDGIVISQGFTARVVDAFLTVLSEDARFRHLPVVLTADELAPSYDLPNLEIITGDPPHIAANTLPLVRQHALEAQLGRTLRAIEAKGLLDPQTGLRRRLPLSAILPAQSARRWPKAGALQSPALPSIPDNRARNSTARGSSAA